MHIVSDEAKASRTNNNKIVECLYDDNLVALVDLRCIKSRSIKSNLTCETKNLIYMIQCNRCNLQYIGETKRRLKDRRTIDNPNTKSKPTTAADHFLTAPNHTANDMQLVPIEKVFSNRDSVRKAREAFLISKGRTLLPHGLNIREEPY